MRFEQPIAVITRHMVFAMVREIKAIRLRNDVKEILGAFGLYSSWHAMSWAHVPAGSTATGSVMPGSWCDTSGQPRNANLLEAAKLSLLVSERGLLGMAKRPETRQHRHQTTLTSCPASSAEPFTQPAAAHRMVG